MNKIGLSVIDDNLKQIELKTVHSDLKDKFERVLANLSMVKSILLPYKSSLSFVAVEEPAWGMTQFVGYDLGMAWGSLMMKLTEEKQSYIRVHNAKLRTFVMPKRFKGKEEVVNYCIKEGVVFPDKTKKEYIEDMADAYVLSRIARLFSAGREDLKTQLKIPENQWRIFHGKDERGREVGLLDRPDLYRIFQT